MRRLLRLWTVWVVSIGLVILVSYQSLLDRRTGKYNNWKNKDKGSRNLLRHCLSESLAKIKLDVYIPYSVAGPHRQ